MDNQMFALLAFPGGMLLGSVFYGGLWFTVQYGTVSKNPALWFLCSFILRIGISLCGFYFISGGNWQRLLICLAGFIIARVIITSLTRSASKQMNHEN